MLMLGSTRSMDRQPLALVWYEIPVPGIEKVSRTPRFETFMVAPLSPILSEARFFPGLMYTPLANRILLRNRKPIL
jgi:hypothetical protein